MFVQTGQRRPLVARARRIPLRVEVLEDRIVPAAPQINSLSAAVMLGQSQSALVTGVLTADDLSTVSVNFSGAATGSSLVDANGNFQFQTSLANLGLLYAQATDGSGTSNQAQVDLAVVNLSSPANQTNVVGNTVNLMLMGWTSNGDSLTYSGAGLPGGLTVTNGMMPAVTGAIASNAAGSYSATVTATDAAAHVSASRVFSWAVNQPTVTVFSPSDQTNAVGTSVNLSVMGWASNGDPLTWTAAGLPNGLTISGGMMPAITGAIAGNASGSYSVTITATDANLPGVSDSKTFTWTINQSSATVTVMKPNDQTSTAGNSVNLPVMGWASNGDPLTWTATGLPNGLTISGGMMPAISGAIASNASGSYSVTITATDANLPGISDSKTFTWTVSQGSGGGNNAPTIGSISLSNTAPKTNDTLTATVVNPYDADGDAITFQYVWTVNGSTVRTTTTTATTDSLNLSVSGNGNKEDVILVTVTPSDPTSNGSAASASATVANSAPTVAGQSLSIGHDQVLVGINLLAGSADVDGDTLQTTIVAAPGHGSVNQNADGTYSYYADAGWTGSDSFTFSASDGAASSSTATISISVTNTAPTASDTTLYVGHDMILPGVDLTQYMTDADGDPLQTIIVSGPSHGDWTQNADGTYIYTPDSSYIGTDTITIKANDGVADSNTATITIEVTPFAPLNVDGSYSVIHDRTLLNIDFSANDNDANGDPWQIDIFISPSHGQLTRNSDGTFNYDPDTGWTGSDTVTIVANGGGVGGVWATVDITLNVTDIAPVAIETAAAIEAYQGISQGLAFLADATDADGEALMIDFVAQPQHGSLSLNSTTGLYDYTATTGYLGRDSFSLRFFDGAKYSDTVTVDVLNYDDSTDFATDAFVQGFAQDVKELTLFQEPLLRSDTLDRRRFYDKPCGNVSTNMPGGGGNITTHLDYFSNDEKNILLARLTTLRPALDAILTDIGNTIPYASSLTFVRWNALNAQMQERLGR